MPHKWVVYKPVTEGSHKIDYFAHSGIDKKVISCEVKTKKTPRKIFRYRNKHKPLRTI